MNVNVVAPGYIDVRGWSDAFPNRATDELRASLVRSIPLGRAGEPTDIAEAVLFLCSDAAAHVSGAVLDVDGGSLAGRYAAAPRAPDVGDVRVVITSPLSPENIAAIAAADPRLDVVYEQDLIPAAEYPSAHPCPRSPTSGPSSAGSSSSRARRSCSTSARSPSPTGSRSGRACAGSRPRAPGWASSRGGSG